MSSRAVLRALRDVPGVIGSFTCGMLGELIAHDMPERFTRAAIETAAARFGNLLQFADEALSDTRGIAVSFAEYRLYARRYAGGLLCVLTEKSLDRRKLAEVADGVLASLSG